MWKSSEEVRWVSIIRLISIEINILVSTIPVEKVGCSGNDFGETPKKIKRKRPMESTTFNHQPTNSQSTPIQPSTFNLQPTNSTSMQSSTFNIQPNNSNQPSIQHTSFNRQPIYSVQPKSFNQSEKEYSDITTLHPADTIISPELFKDFMNMNIPLPPNSDGSITTNTVEEVSVVGYNERRPRPLICQHPYYLNKSMTKFVAVGLKIEWNLDPAVCILGRARQGTQCITFTIEQWHEFIKHADIITQYCSNMQTQEICPVMQQVGFKITCEWIENRTKVLKIVHGDEWLYLALDGLLELWKHKDIISTRLEYLKYLNMKDYYNQVMNIVTSMEGDLRRNVLHISNGEVTEQLCIMKEIILYGFDRLKFDFDVRKMLLS